MSPSHHSFYDWFKSWKHFIFVSFESPAPKTLLWRRKKRRNWLFLFVAFLNVGEVLLRFFLLKSTDLYFCPTTHLSASQQPIRRPEPHLAEIQGVEISRLVMINQIQRNVQTEVGLFSPGGPFSSFSTAFSHIIWPSSRCHMNKFLFLTTFRMFF